MKSKHFDVFVIGSGIAGQTAAKICAQAGLQTAIADNRAFGGTCALRGCDPKKVLIQFADLVKISEQLKGSGVKDIPKLNWKAVQRFKSKFTKPVPKQTEKNLEDLGITLYHQSPKFLTTKKIQVEGKQVTADKFVIATGFEARPLHLPGSQHLKTSDDLLNLKALPKSAIFIGSGYVGMEFCYMLSSLGCKVTMLDSGERPLAPFDSFLVDKLVESMKAKGVNFIFNAIPKTIKKLKKNYKVVYNTSGISTSIKARAVFNSSGRVPAVTELDLEKANISYDSSGILVNDYLQSLSRASVYACGDVSSKSLPLTPLSGLQGYIAGSNLVKENSKVFKNPLVPSVVFTQPQLAGVGYSEEEAKSRYKNVQVFQGDALDWYNAKKENAAAYAFKILVNERTQKIVGAHLLSSEASESINIFTTVIETGMTIHDFKNLIFTYPSFASDLKSMLAIEK